MGRKITCFEGPSILTQIEEAPTTLVLAEILEYALKHCDPNPKTVRRWEEAALQRTTELLKDPPKFEKVTGSPLDLLPMEPKLEQPAQDPASARAEDSGAAMIEAGLTTADDVAMVVEGNRHLACAELGVFEFEGHPARNGKPIPIADYFRHGAVFLRCGEALSDGKDHPGKPVLGVPGDSVVTLSEADLPKRRH